MTSGNSLCPHLLQEYFKRVEEIITVYRPQLKFIKYEDISGSLLSRKILRLEEHESIRRLKSEGGQMDKALNTLQSRMWGFENLVTVLIEKHVDSWLVEEMFEKYVHHIVNEIRRQQGLRNCKCFEHEKRSIIRKAVVRFFEKCDKWLFEIGTSIGFVTMSIYPTHNSLQFINNCFPIPRKTDSDEMLSLPSIEYTPFEYKYDHHDENRVEITEVATDSERSSSSSGSSSGGQATGEDEVKRKSVPLSPKTKKTVSSSSPTGPQTVSGNRSKSTSMSSSTSSRLSSTKKIPARSSPAPLVKSTRAVSPTISLTSSIKVQQNHADPDEPENLAAEQVSSSTLKQAKDGNEGETPLLVTAKAVSGSISTSMSSPPLESSSLSENNSTDYKSSLVFLPVRLQLPTKIGSTAESTAFLPTDNTNPDDNNTNCFILSSIPLNEMMMGSKNGYAASASENNESASSTAAATVVVKNYKNLPIMSAYSSSSLTRESVKNEQNLNNVDKINELKKKASSRKVLVRPSRIPSVKKQDKEQTKATSVVSSSKKFEEVPSTKISIKKSSTSVQNSEADDEEEEVFVDAQPFLENSENSLEFKNLVSTETTTQCSDLKTKLEDNSGDKNTQTDIPTSTITLSTDTQRNSSSSTEGAAAVPPPPAAAVEMTQTKKVVSINGRLVEKKIPSSHLGKTKVSNSQVTTDPSRTNKLVSSASSPKLISSKTNNSSSSFPPKIISLSIGKDNNSDKLKTRNLSTRPPVKVTTPTSSTMRVRNLVEKNQEKSSSSINKESVVELTPEFGSVEIVKDKFIKSDNDNDENGDTKLSHPVSNGALLLSSDRESDFTEGKENIDDSNTQVQCPDSKKIHLKVSSLLSCKTNQDEPTKKSMLITTIGGQTEKSKIGAGNMANQNQKTSTTTTSKVLQKIKPQTVKDLNNNNNKFKIMSTTTTPIKTMTVRSKSLSEKSSTTATPNSNKMADSHSRNRIKSLGTTSKLITVQKGTVKTNRLESHPNTDNNNDESRIQKVIKDSIKLQLNSSFTLENDSGHSSSEQLAAFDTITAASSNNPLLNIDKNTEKQAKNPNNVTMTLTVGQQTSVDNNIGEEQLLALLSSHLTRQPSESAFKFQKRNSCPSLTNEISNFEQRQQQQPKIIVEKNTPKIHRTKSDSKLYTDSMKTLPEQVGNMLEQLSMELLGKIWKKIQQDCSASLEHEIEAEEAILSLTKSVSDSQSSSTGQLEQGAHVKLLVDASSQTVLKMKSVSQTASSPPPTTSSSPATTMQRPVVAKSSDSKLDPGKKTASTTTTNVGSFSNGKSINQKSTTSNNNNSADNAKVRPKANSTPVKPVWSNKKPSPAPLVTSDRYSIFSSDDYNFQLWANEWASRQDKKKTDEEMSRNSNNHINV